jgi:hypothetical protein
MQWRIVPSDREGSYTYVVLQISQWRLFIAIIIKDIRSGWSGLLESIERLSQNTGIATPLNVRRIIS